MSEKSPIKPARHEHGTIKSYVIGFILSLVFTLIPYYLVVHQTIRGTALLLAILSFAVIQMIIQVTFFLHLGRGPKPNWNFFFFISTVGIILVVVGGSIIIINNLHYNMQAPDQVKRLIDDEAIYQIGGVKTGACQGQRQNHRVIILKGQVYPEHTNAKLCDTLTFMNDKTIREIGFGDHDHHTPYAGNTELPLRPKQSMTITLSQTGNYRFHDHFHEFTAGTFTVVP
jgi:cytochrome o ubiquinol oxidase operon protein cyoD